MVSLPVRRSVSLVGLPSLAQGSDDRAPWRGAVFRRISGLGPGKQKGMLTRWLKHETEQKKENFNDCLVGELERWWVGYIV